MKKQIVRLTESDLHKIIENSVNRVLKEYEDPWYKANQPKGFFGGMKSSYNNDDNDYSEHDEKETHMLDDSTGLDRLKHHMQYGATKAGRTLGKLGRYMYKPSPKDEYNRNER